MMDRPASVSGMRFFGIALVLTIGLAGAAFAQSSGEASGSGQGSPRGGALACPAISSNALPMKTFYLKNVSQPNDGNEILTGLRLMLEPSTKLYLVPTLNAIVIRGCPEDLAAAQKLLDEIDRPHRKYKLTFTLTEMEGAQRLGVQHVSLLVEEGQRATVKSGSKVPIVTGSYNAGTNGAQTQMTYLDIGTNVDATPIASGDQVTLKAKLEQSSVAEDKSGVGPQDPIVRQSVLESVSLLTLGKEQTLGAVDITGSTRRLDIAVMAEAVR